MLLTGTKTKMKSITHFLTSPCVVAHKLDWSKATGNLLNVSISNTCIDLAVASHPSFEEPAEELAAIPLEIETHNKSIRLREGIVGEFDACMRQHKICGLVVAWPVRKQGRCGYACGHVLHTLDQLTPALLKYGTNKPVCLYDHNHYLPDEDEWGRAKAHGEACFDKTFIKASEEQYSCKPLCSTDLWDRFVFEHWPHLFPNKHFETVDSFLGRSPNQYQNNIFRSSWDNLGKPLHAVNL